MLNIALCCCCSVSNCVWLFATHILQHTDFPIFIISWSLPKSCPLSYWSHPIILSSVTPFTSCPQSSPASGSFQMSQLFTSGGQSIGVSPSILPMNIQGWFPLGLTGFISLLSKGLSSLLQHNWKASILQHSAIFIAQLSHPCTTTGKTIALTRRTFVGKCGYFFKQWSL